MKLNTTLSGIAALLLVAVFYTFAFMVEDVEENAISMEYYYSTETEAVTESTETEIDLGADNNKENAELVEIPSVNDVVEAVPALPENTNDEENEEENIPAETEKNEEPAVTTAAPVREEEEKTVSAAPKDTQADVEDETDYPEDFEVDEYDNGSSEAKEQSVFGEDSNEDKVLSNSDEEPDEDDTLETTAPETESEDETITFVFDEEETDFDTTAPDASEDIIITLWFDETAKETETSVSVNVGSGVDISTDETFTAKFNGSTQTVNAYDLICQIVNNEISTSFSDEAIKAQAVAAYSYVKYHNVNGLTPSVLVKGNVPQRIKDLVSEVWGVCCYYNGNVAQTVYMASSSGYTTDAKNVWGSSVPYLKSVYCPFDVTSDPNYGYQMKVSEENMRTLVEGDLGITLSNNPSNWFTVTEIVDGNYVAKVNVDGQKIITGRAMRESILNYKLKSTAFEVTYSDGYFIFTTYGYGHGVGMSQNGANILAKQGYSYEEILKHYFTGIEII
ncbi:MAG: SpoIID/LytB domain-containing protein [Oscillospiraceae bacterium]|nr:SpoIID/LytB domain-containing protein [Oscillospiraceae bacterium]